MQNEQRSQRFDFIRFCINAYRMLRSRGWQIFVAILLGACLGGVYAWQTYQPTYEARAVLSVNVSRRTAITDIISDNALNDSNTAVQISNTFQTMMHTDSMQQKVMDELGGRPINGQIACSSIEGSNLYTFSVISTSPQNAYDILQAIIKCYPQMAYYVIGNARIQVVEDPVMPQKPISSMNLMNSILFGGVLLGMAMLALLCILGQYQQYIASSTELKRYTGVPCLTHIPYRAPKHRSAKEFHVDIQDKNISTSYVEAVRVLRTRILHRIKGKKPCTILITSTMPGEGKTTVSVNLAKTLAQTGLRVILVDGDLRTQQIRAFFGIGRKTGGLADLLRHPDKTSVAALEKAKGLSLWILTGEIVNRPLPLLQAGKLEKIFDRLKMEADVILVDTPPIGLLADASTYALCADYALYLVLAGGCSGHRIAEGMQRVADGNAKILGYALNGVSPKNNAYGYGYGGYGYGGHSYGGHGYGGYSGYGSYGSYGSYAKKPNQAAQEAASAGAAISQTMAADAAQDQKTKEHDSIRSEKSTGKEQKTTDNSSGKKGKKPAYRV